MNRRVLRVLCSCAAALLLPSGLFGAGGVPVPRADSAPASAQAPAAPLRPVRFQHVKIGGFWQDQIKRLTEKWIPHCIRQMEKGGRGSRRAGTQFRPRGRGPQGRPGREVHRLPVE